MEYQKNGATAAATATSEPGSKLLILLLLHLTYGDEGALYNQGFYTKK